LQGANAVGAFNFSAPDIGAAQIGANQFMSQVTQSNPFLWSGSF